MDHLSPDDEQQARELIKSLSELKTKAELLSEHVENRKVALEEEIEESLHEAIANAQDSLEKVYENIEPKLEKTIREKLDEIKTQMDVWKQDAKRIVGQEIDAKSDEMGQILLNGLEARIQERTDGFMQQMKTYVDEQVAEKIDGRLKSLKETHEQELEKVRGLAVAGISIGALGVIAAVVAMFF